MALAPWTGIPGETPIDLSDLTPSAKARGIVTRRELNELEAQNIARVFVKYLSAKPSPHLAPFDYTWSLKVHEEMFRDVWRWAGVPRQHDVNIGVPFFNVSGELYGLLADLHAWSGLNMPFIEQATRLHHRAVAIHPFPNGNGRWSRLLSNIWLKRHGIPVVEWPEETIGQQSVVRSEYIAAIEAADDGDCAPLIKLHEQFVRKDKLS